MEYKNLDTETLIEVATIMSVSKLTITKSGGGWNVYDEKTKFLRENSVNSLNEALMYFIANREE